MQVYTCAFVVCSFVPNQSKIFLVSIPKPYSHYPMCVYVFVCPVIISKSKQNLSDFISKAFFSLSRFSIRYIQFDKSGFNFGEACQTRVDP